MKKMAINICKMSRYINHLSHIFITSNCHFINLLFLTHFLTVFLSQSTSSYITPPLYSVKKNLSCILPPQRSQKTKMDTDI